MNGIPRQMTKHTVTYKAHEVVVVPFPFTDKDSSKRRPALVLSDAHAFNIPVGQSVLAMITSAANSSWPLDVEISDLDSAGLTSASIVRMKLFTLDHQLILRYDLFDLQGRSFLSDVWVILFWFFQPACPGWQFD